MISALLLALLGAAAQAEPATGAAAPDPDARPHLVLVLTDDQRADTVGAWGNPHIRTPHLDALAARGTSFHRAYCMGSRGGAVCVPSR
ncbi:MAG: sulfatase-like hydrolase/transferase, partial [Planctomycetota bacterium]|nr:sulfatase-like hydrolase/transferase [Planctomycetota bacterium]